MHGIGVSDPNGQKLPAGHAIGDPVEHEKPPGHVVQLSWRTRELPRSAA